MDNGKIGYFLLEKRSDKIMWKKNPPMASNIGGVRERKIRSSKTTCSSLRRTHSMSFNEESLSTLLASWSYCLTQNLWWQKQKSVNSEVAISQSHILTMKSKVVMAPPGVW